MNPLGHIMSVEQASELWNLHPSYIKNLCARGKVKAVKLGKTWILDKNQPNPSAKKNTIVTFIGWPDTDYDPDLELDRVIEKGDAYK